MNLCKVIAVPVCGAALVSAGFGIAQDRQAQPGQTQQSGQTAEAGQRAQWQNADQTLATCAAIDIHEKVALAKSVQDKV